MPVSNHMAIDELFRWQHHNEHVRSEQVQYMKQILPLRSWWKEHGAFVSMPGRHTGKTTMANMIYDRLTSGGLNVFVVTPFRGMIDISYQGKNAASAEGLNLRDRGIQPTHYHLIIDEYTILKKEELNALLDHEWLSVTMFGTVL